MNNALGRTMSFTIQCRILRSFLSRLRHLSAAIASVTYLSSCEESLSCDITTSIYIHPSHSVTTTNIFIDPSHSETTTNIFIRPSHSLSQQQISSYILLTLSQQQIYSSFTNITVHFYLPCIFLIFTFYFKSHYSSS